MIQWTRSLSRYQSHLQELVAREDSSLPHITKVLSCGLASQKEEIAEMSARNLLDLYRHEGLKNRMEE